MQQSRFAERTRGPVSPCTARGHLETVPSLTALPLET